MAQSSRISVVIATYGRSELLLECIASILHNHCMDFELLIVDQNPTNAFQTELSNSFDADPRIRYIPLDVVGLSIARNKGVEHARSEIVVFCDDDVEVTPEWLQAYFEAFTSVQPMPGVVAGQVEPLWLAPKPQWYPDEEHREHLLGIYRNRGNSLIPMPEGELPVGANFAILRDIVSQIGGFDERVGFSYNRRHPMIGGEDSLFTLKAKQAGYPIYYQPSAKVMHKISDRKLTKTHFLKRNFWQGVTTIVVMHLCTPLVLENLNGVIQYHTKHIARQLRQMFFPIRRSVKFYMNGLATISESLGIIYTCLKIRRTGNIP